MCESVTKGNRRCKNGGLWCKVHNNERESKVERYSEMLYILSKVVVYDIAIIIMNDIIRYGRRIEIVDYSIMNGIYYKREQVKVPNGIISLFYTNRVIRSVIRKLAKRNQKVKYRETSTGSAQDIVERIKPVWMTQGLKNTEEKLEYRILRSYKMIRGTEYIYAYV